MREGDVKQNLVFILAFQKARDGRVGCSLHAAVPGEPLPSLTPSSSTAGEPDPPVWAQPGVQPVVPGSKRGNRLLWLLGRVQPWTCPGQCLVNDSFVGVAGWLGSARDGHVSHWLGCRKIPCQQQNQCLGWAKPVLAAYRDQPPVLCFLLPCVGLRHHLSVSRCRVALGKPGAVSGDLACASGARWERGLPAARGHQLCFSQHIWIPASDVHQWNTEQEETRRVPTVLCGMPRAWGGMPGRCWHVSSSE